MEEEVKASKPSSEAWQGHPRGVIRFIERLSSLRQALAFSPVIRPAQNFLLTKQDHSVILSRQNKAGRVPPPHPQRTAKGSTV